MAVEHPVSVQAPSAGTLRSSRRVIFALIAVGLFMSSIDTTIVATALPAIHSSLHPPSTGPAGPSRSTASAW
jgi:hypothetical protein